MKKKKKKVNSPVILLILNIGILIINIFIGIYSIMKDRHEIVNIDYNAIKTNIDIIKEMPLFEVQYLESDYFSIRSIALSDENISKDSVSSNPFENYYVDKNHILKYYESFEHYAYDITALAIKQIGPSLATDVRIEFYRIKSKCGLELFAFANEDIHAYLEMGQDIQGYPVQKEDLIVRYGDIPSNRGIIIPLLRIELYKGDTIQTIGDTMQYYKTNTDILIPKSLSFGNIYNDQRQTIKIRQINNSKISTYLQFNIRG